MSKTAGLSMPYARWPTRDQHAWLATRLIIEEGLEAEVRDTLGRDYYEHGQAASQG